MKYEIYNVRDNKKEEIEEIVREITDGHIWYKDSFQLNRYMTGETDVGDCIDDEWLITYALFEISRRVPECVIRTEDSDGDFLLIEAAYYLPEWLEPETSENRVFIHQGKLHIVTLDQRLDLSDDIQAAIDIVLDPEQDTVASDEIQQAIERKIRQYPAAIVGNLHHSRVLVPAVAAKLLKQDPTLISHAVRAFYYREPKAATGICNRMKTFEPKDIVQVSVQFTKCMYAQLKQQEFHPPKPFQSYMPSKDVLAADIGMKLTCGLELYVASLDTMPDQMESCLNEPVDVEALDETDCCRNDDDSWLEIEPESLEQMLQEASGRQDSTLDDVAMMMKRFVGDESSYMGAEVPSMKRMDLNVSKLMGILCGEDYKGEEDGEDDYMQELEEELRATTISNSMSEEIDVDLMSNLLESVASQEGRAGPASNLLNEMGFSKR